MQIHDKIQLGRLGEEIAIKYLKANKYIIRDVNFYCRQGEIDIIAEDSKQIVFVEVKTRSSTKFGMPVEAVDKNKQRHMYKSAEYYLFKNNLENKSIRFDVVEILIKRGVFNVRHIKQIF